eukprot:Em0401g4a
MAGVMPCRSLRYVLRALGNCRLMLSDVIVNIEYGSTIVEPSTYTFSCDLKLHIKGSAAVDAPSAICLADESLTFVASPNVSVSMQWESLCIVNCSGPQAIGLADTSYVEVRGSQFLFTEAYDVDASFVITNEATTQLSITDSAFVRGTPAEKEGNSPLGCNRAQYGSSVYIEDVVCPLLNTSIGYPNFIFQNGPNTGQTIVYFDGDLNGCIDNRNLSYNLAFDTAAADSLFATAATNFSADLLENFDVFPGKDVILNVVLKDYFRNAAICSANISMTVMDHSEQLNISCNDPRYQVELICPFASLSQTSMILSDTTGANSTLRIRTARDPAWLQLDSNVTINLHAIMDGVQRPQYHLLFKTARHF